MPVTSFNSFIGVQSGGTADVDKLAASFDKLSTSITQANDGSKKLSEHPGFDSFASKVKQGITDPLGAISSGAETALKSIGPVGTGIAAVGSIFVASAAAGFEAARSLGEYATQI